MTHRVSIALWFSAAVIAAASAMFQINTQEETRREIEDITLAEFLCKLPDENTKAKLLVDQGVKDTKVTLPADSDVLIQPLKLHR